MTNLERRIYAAQTPEDWKCMYKQFPVEKIAEFFNCTVKQVLVKVKSK